MSDGYRLNAIIDAAQIIGNGILDLRDAVTDVINVLSENQEEEEQAEPKEEEKHLW